MRAGFLIGARQRHGAGVDLAAQRLAQDRGLFADLLDQRHVHGVALLVEARACLARGHLAGALPCLPRAQRHHQQVAKAAGHLLRLLRRSRPAGPAPCASASRSSSLTGAPSTRKSRWRGSDSGGAVAAVGRAQQVAQGDRRRGCRCPSAPGSWSAARAPRSLSTRPPAPRSPPAPRPAGHCPARQSG